MNALIKPILEQVENIKIDAQPVEHIQNCCVLFLKGYLDSFNASAFEKQIKRLVNLDYSKLIFEFSGVSYCSSLGIGKLVAILKKCKNLGGDVIIMNIIQSVKVVFDLLGFGVFFKVLSGDIQDGLFYFKSSPTKTLFPFFFKCPICEKKLKVPKANTYRCPECKTKLKISQTTEVLLV